MMTTCSRLYNQHKLTYEGLLTIISNVLVSVGYAAPSLMALVDTKVTCGQLDFENVIHGHRYRFLSMMSETYAFVTDHSRGETELPVRLRPDVAKLEAAKLGLALKLSLACLRYKKVREGRNLFMAIDGLIEAITARLDMTQKMLDLRSEMVEMLRMKSLPRQRFWNIP